MQVIKLTKKQKKQALQPGSVVVQPTVVSTLPVKAGTGKAARRRRNRQRRRMYVSQPEPLSTSMGVTGSVARTVDSLFFPQSGIHRGVAFGFENTALAYIKGFSDIALSGANTTWTFAFRPSNCGTNNWLQWAIGAALIDPVAAPTYQEPAAITSTQATAIRVVSFSASIIPTGPYTTQSGDGSVGYVPTNTGFTFTTSSLVNLVMQKPFNGVTPLELHWVPADGDARDETAMHSLTSANASSLVGTFATQGSASFRLEWRLGIEYVPSVAYRPFVNKASPINHPDTYYYINKMVGADWGTLIIAYADEYRMALAKHNHAGGGLDQIEALNSMGSYRIGQHEPTLGDEEEIIAEENYMHRAGKAAKRTLCDVASGFAGFEVCDNPLEGLKRITKPYFTNGRGVLGIDEPLMIRQ